MAASAAPDQFAFFIKRSTLLSALNWCSSFMGVISLLTQHIREKEKTQEKKRDEVNACHSLDPMVDAERKSPLAARAFAMNSR